MSSTGAGKFIFGLGVAGLILLVWVIRAAAVPSFHRQTGLACSACHLMGVYPELTPLGRTFKLTGYVLNKTGAKCPTTPPLSGMAQFSFTHTEKAQPPGSLPDNRWSLHALSSQNDVLGTPQAASIFYGGQIYDKIGALVQATYSNDNDLLSLDMADVRYANNYSFCGKNLIYGITVNNNPTDEDLWNSTPAWGFPYAASNVAPSPAADVLIDNALSALVGGGGLYGYWDNTIYAAAAVYRTALNGITAPFGVGNHPLGLYTDGPIPYWRLAYTRQFDSNYIEIGTYGLVSDVYVSGHGGPTDNFRDVAFDAQYQYIRSDHAFSLETTWIHENQDRSGSFLEQAAANRSDYLDTFRINGNAYRRFRCGSFGGTISYFSTTGSNDPVLYSGNVNGNPDSDGEIFELDYRPKWTCPYSKFSLQYVLYNHFDGTSVHASDNNTVYLLAWFMF